MTSPSSFRPLPASASRRHYRPLRSTFAALLLAALASSRGRPVVHRRHSRPGPLSQRHQGSDRPRHGRPRRRHQGHRPRRQHARGALQKPRPRRPPEPTASFQPFSVITGAKLLGDQQHSGTSRQRHQGPQAQRPSLCPSAFPPPAKPTRRSSLPATARPPIEFNYDDYDGIDVRGKIVVLLRYEPPGFAAHGGNQGLTQHAALDHQSDQRSQPRRQSRRGRQRQARRRRARLSHALRQRQRPRKRRHHPGASEEQCRATLVRRSREVACRRSEPDQRRGQARHRSPFLTPCILASTSASRPRAPRSTTSWPTSPAKPTNTSSSARTTIISATAITIRSRLRRSARFIPAPTTTPPARPACSNSRACSLRSRASFERGILFASFAGEELGLLGSAEWVKDPTRPLDRRHRHAQHGHDRPHPRRTRSTSAASAPARRSNRSSPAVEKNSNFTFAVFARRLRLERPHLLRRQKNSRALLFLRPARRLPPPFRHLGQDQCPRCRTTARSRRPGRASDR